MLTRRTLLKRASATLMLPTLLSSRARAQLNPSNWAVTFDGNTYLSNPGSGLGLPATSPYGLLVYSYRATTIGGAGQATIVGAGSVSEGAFNAIHYQQDSNFYAQLSVAVPTPGGLQPGMYAWTEVPYDGKWHTMIGAWDATVPKAVFILDGQSLTSSYSSANTTTGTIAYANNTIYVGGQPNYIGDMANLMLYVPPAFVDPTPEAFVDSFYDAETGYAARQASTGSGPGANANPPWMPQAFLTGGAKLFLMNLAASSGQFNWPDNYSGSAFSVTGTLTTASSDPFTPNSPY